MRFGLAQRGGYDNDTEQEELMDYVKRRGG